MLAAEAAQDAIAQNLANGNTIGYKQDIPQFQSFSEVLLNRMGSAGPGAAVGTLSTGVSVGALATDFAQGPMQQTNNPLDVALTGNAYLTLQTAQGPRYSRDGALSLTAQGNLVQTSTGLPVLGQNGQPLNIPAGTKDIGISATGSVFADSTVVGQLALVGVSRAAGAVKQGNGLFTEPNAPTPAAGSSVKQGYLEGSNVNVVQTMIAMIEADRTFQADQKAILTEDELTSHAITDVGKPV